MKQNDDQETQRLDARNSLEEFIYETRDSMASPQNANAFNNNAQSFLALLESIENWIYEEAENSKLETYEKFLKELVDFEILQRIQRIDDEDDFEVDLDMLSKRLEKFVADANNDVSV